MTNKVNNSAVKKFMENVEKFHDNKEIVDIIQAYKFFGLSKTSKGSLNALYMFVVLKEAEEITNKEVKRIIENFRTELAYKQMIKNADSKFEKQYIKNNMKYSDGEYNMMLLEAFGERHTVIDERHYRRYGNAIREASKAIQELLEREPVVEEKVILTRAQKQTIERWFDDGITDDAILNYLKARKNG
ncbi:MULTISPECIES: hypothetical protein [unclassified Citrobacter]|uniref:hypothetical protein n=1 Tax=unclassified Citrobacter TaxID=2644389 RepID=UPI0025756733|nr:MULTISPECIES: hypothetical protein [unclassified Citrobacter]MDM2787131.1 hypothetical protein [Citrobacter sp. Cpo113]MDM2841653.1 hypothetical protein [Citrobacter sp. Cpo086]